MHTHVRLRSAVANVEEGSMTVVFGGRRWDLLENRLVREGLLRRRPRELGPEWQEWRGSRLRAMFDPREELPPKQEQACVAGVERGRVRKAGARWHGGVRSRPSVPGTGMALPYREGGPAACPLQFSGRCCSFFPTADAFLSCKPCCSLRFPVQAVGSAPWGRLQVITRNQQKGRKMLLPFALHSCQFWWLAKPVFLFGNRLFFWINTLGWDCRF